MEDLANAIYNLLGLKGTSLLTFLIVLSMVCQLVTRLIPDDATGWKKYVRMVTAAVGLYASSRVTSGITVADAAREIVKAPLDEVTDTAQEVAERVDERIEDVTDEIREVVPAFPGLKRRRDEDGNFLPILGGE